MRFRGKSIRRKIVALLLVPLVSLTAMWGFATVLTGRSAFKLLSVAETVDKVGYPIRDAATVIQEERRRTLVYLADPGSSDALAALRGSRDATDAKLAKIASNANDSDVRDRVGGETEKKLDAVLDAFEGITSLRRSVEEGTVTRAGALKLYTRLIDPCYDFLGTLNAVDDVDLVEHGRALVSMARARELLSREDALVGSALVLRRLTESELRQVSDLRAQRKLLYDVALPQLPGEERARYERYWNGAETTELRAAEKAVVESAPGTPRAVTSDRWNASAGKALKDLAQRGIEGSDHFRDRVEPAAAGVLVRVGIAGVLGLLALLFSVFLSVRIGRSLIRDLRRLRLEAHEASGVRLPGVLRRLAAGEHVDVETEAPKLSYEKDEIGQVGQALNTLQRAAVEATVKQADLRRGVSEVFVNLARRSQVLLHKQLTLLDAMERRTEDTDELADLFRLDHLTTRMRRHAEGLVILSGAAPSRQWRKPVQLMDVVRAAVAEVEDYERIEVRRLPRIAVTGPAVADLTHLLAELLENATVFSPPHTAVQVLGEHVANGFTLEIHDRGLGMASDALLDANLRLAETPEFELSDTDRLGLFVVSRLAQRQRVRVSLQPSPYGGTTAVVFIPEALLTDDVPDTGGIGFRLDRPQPKEPVADRARDDRTGALAQVPVPLPGLPASVLDGPVELEAPVGMAGLDTFPGALDDEDSERGGLFRPRRRTGGVPVGEQHQQARDERETGRAGTSRSGPARADEVSRHEGPDDVADSGDDAGPVPLPRRRTPKLVSSHGRPVGRTPDGKAGLPRRRPRTDQPTRAEAPPEPRPQEPPTEAGTEPRTGSGAPSSPPGALPRRVRQASLAPQLKDGPERRTEREDPPAGPGPEERDAEEVRNRMASLQRGWQRGRIENGELPGTAGEPAAPEHHKTNRNARGGDTADGSTAPGTTSEGDGR